MPSSGDSAGKRKRGDTSLPSPKRHKPNHGKNPQIKIRGILKWNLRSRRNVTEDINSPSTSSTKETIAKKCVKRNATEEVKNFEYSGKQHSNTVEYKKSKEGNQLEETGIPIYDTKEQRNPAYIKETERSDEILGVHDNGKCMENSTAEEQRTGKTTQERKKNPFLNAAGDEIDEKLENKNQLKENQSNTETLTTDIIQNETICIDSKNNEQSEEAMEKNTSMYEEDNTKLELDKGIKEDEEPSVEDIEDENNEKGIKSEIPSIAQESSSKEDCAAETPGFDSSVPSLSVTEKTGIPLESKIN